MRKHIVTFVVAILGFIAGAGFNNLAVSNAMQYKIAVIDINQVVKKSAQVQELKKEQAKKTAELRTWLKGVKEEVSKQPNEEAKKKLTKKYDGEFAKKQTEIKKNYATKLKAIDKSISETIAQKAQEQGYDMVIAKNSVLYGGDDITAAVAKVVK